MVCGGVGKGGSQLEQREHRRRRVPIGNGWARSCREEGAHLWGEKVESGARLEFDGSGRALNTETNQLTLPWPFFLSVWEAPVSPFVS